MRAAFAVAVWLLAGAAWAAGPAADVAADPALERRVQALAAELRCLVCQNQSLADSHAPLAVDLKNHVREQLQAGRSQTEVLAYMTERYGDFVLYRPPVKPSTLLLWGGPALLVLAGLVLLLRTLARTRREPEPAAADDAQRRRAEALLEGADVDPGSTARVAGSAPSTSAPSTST